MARPGVTYQDIANAANELKGQGRSITIENVRAVLGTGSIGTINNHLRKWKEAQNSTHKITVKENVPEDLVALMKGLWERTCAQAIEQFVPVEENFQQEIDELKEELEKYKTNNQRWQKLYDRWLHEKNKFAHEKITLEQALDFSQKENASLGAKQDSLLQQLQDKQNRIEELHALHRQSQANLEHYRETAREQRLMDQQQHESHVNQLQAEVKNHRDQFVIQQEKIAMYQHEYKSVQQALRIMEKSNEHAQDNIIKLTADLNNAENDKLKQMNDCLHWQDQHERQHEILKEKSHQIIDIQAEHKLLSQQLSDMKQQLKELQDQNKLLSHERWTFAQEKAHLEGQLKQMQKLITA